MSHIPVLLQEAIDGLSPKAGEIFVDATINGGGHSEEVARRFGKKIKIVGIDLDSDALERAKERLARRGADFLLLEGSFRNMDEILAKAGITKVDKILFDLGWSTNQFEESGRGFSFTRDERLSMTFKKDPTKEDLTAEEIINKWDEEHIAQILWSYGEERYSRRIAKNIVEARSARPIRTTFELVEIIRKATPFMYHHGKIHFATKTFQALRITTNDEIMSLKDGLAKAFRILSPSGRIGVISFHSTEDRIVKYYFRELADAKKATLLNKKPIVPSDLEVSENRRARSAKLRIIEKLND